MQTELPFKTEWELICEGAKRFELWMEEEDRRMEQEKLRQENVDNLWITKGKEVKNNEKTRHVYVDPGLYISGNRILGSFHNKRNIKFGNIDEFNPVLYGSKTVPKG